MVWFVLVVSMIHAINGFSTALFAIHHPSRSSRCSLRNLHARPKRAATEPTIITSSLQIPTSKITERLLQLTSNPNIAILVDAENIRGKTNFELTHADLLDRLMVWSSLRNHAYGRCIVVIDHGSKPTAHLLSQLKGYGICVTFSGPNQKADDVIARDTQWLLNQTDVSQVIVITADRELSFRCRNANPAAGTSKEKRKLKRKTRKSRKMAVQTHMGEIVAGEGTLMHDNTTDITFNHTTMRVNVINSKRFLEDMDSALREWMDDMEARSTACSTDPPTIEFLDNEDVVPNGNWSNLLELRGKILYLESCLRNKCTVRKRQQLTQEMHQCKEQWEVELSSISDAHIETNKGSLGQLINMALPTHTSNESWEALSVEEQKQLLLRWGKRRGSPKREATEDRIILAEMVRSQLEKVVLDTSMDEEASLVLSYADYINNLTNYNTNTT